MIRKKYFVGFAAALSMMAACNSNQADDASKGNESSIAEDASLMQDAKNLFQVLPTEALNPENEITSAKVQLGKTLYFDNRLSKNNTQSCNSCHNLSSFGVDNKPTSAGDLGKNGNRNSPTVLNAALHASQFWDGRAKNVEEQAGMPVLNPVEMNMPSEKFVEQRFSSIKGYQALFADAYPNEKNAITYSNIRKAIAAFERTLLTPSRFDKYLAGDASALNADEKKGLRVFMETGCATCHNGAAKGGNMIQKFPVFGETYVQATHSTHDDLGKFENTKDEMDKHLFKVPSLINISKTYPYFHDGSVAKLEDAIRIMAKLQLNKEINQEQIASIKTFLLSLDGEVPSAAFITPSMPQ